MKLPKSPTASSGIPTFASTCAALPPSSSTSSGKPVSEVPRMSIMGRPYGGVVPNRPGSQSLLAARPAFRDVRQTAQGLDISPGERQVAQHLRHQLRGAAVRVLLDHDPGLG